MRELPEDQISGPMRFDPAVLDQIMVPGNKWFELQAGVDFPTDVALKAVRQRLYVAAYRRGGRLATRFTEEGNIQVYATGCRF